MRLLSRLPPCWADADRGSAPYDHSDRLLLLAKALPGAAAVECPDDVISGGGWRTALVAAVAEVDEAAAVAVPLIIDAASHVSWCTGQWRCWQSNEQ